MKIFTYLLFTVATQRENTVLKSAIPSGTWRPQSSTPEPYHVAKFLRDKSNNDVVKLLMNASPARSPSPVRFHRNTADRQQKVGSGYQAAITNSLGKKASPGSTSEEPSGHHSPLPGNKVIPRTKLAQEGANKDGSSVKNIVFLRTVHTLYKCKKTENALVEKQSPETTQNCSSSTLQQGTLSFKTFYRLPKMT